MRHWIGVKLRYSLGSAVVGGDVRHGIAEHTSGSDSRMRFPYRTGCGDPSGRANGDCWRLPAACSAISTAWRSSHHPPDQAQCAAVDERTDPRHRAVNTEPEPPTRGLRTWQP
jgi:hypothetical protein